MMSAGGKVKVLITFLKAVNMKPNKTGSGARCFLIQAITGPFSEGAHTQLRGNTWPLSHLSKNWMLNNNKKKNNRSFKQSQNRMEK